MITDADHAAAQAEWKREHPLQKWDDLATRIKNRLAREQMFHREFRELSNAIKGVRK